MNAIDYDVGSPMHSINRCPDASSLQSWLDTTLSSTQSANIQSHLLSCHSCLLRLGDLPPCSPSSWLTATDQWGSTLSLAVVGTEPFAQHLVETLKVHGWNVSHDASFPAWAARSADHRCLVGLPAQLNQLSYAFISFLNHLTTRTQRSSFTEFSPDQVPSQTADTEPETCDRPATPTTESTTPHIGRAA